MAQFVYRGSVINALDSNRNIVLLDLGFRIKTPHTFRLPDTRDQFPVGSDVIAFVSRDDSGRWIGELLPSDDPDGLAMLWHYPARLIKVVDGDTIDARVDLGCSVSLDERFRLSDISAPEIFGAGKLSPDYARGLSAKAYLEARFNENGGAMNLVSSRQGKWRRWLAYVIVADGRKTLNFELIDMGLADYAPSHRRPRTRKTKSRVSINLEPDLHARLTDRAKKLQLTPGAVLRNALVEFLRP